jgi:hypothetical protein
VCQGAPSTRTQGEGSRAIIRGPREAHHDRCIRRLLEECDLLKDGIALMDTPDGEPLSAEDRDRLFERSLRAMMARLCRDEPGKALTCYPAMATQLRGLEDEYSKAAERSALLQALESQKDAVGISERCDPPAKRSEPKL